MPAKQEFYMVKTTKNNIFKFVIVLAGVVLMTTSLPCDAFAANNQPLPSAGIDFALSSGGVSIKEVKEEVKAKKTTSVAKTAPAAKTASKPAQTATLSSTLEQVAAPQPVMAATSADAAKETEPINNSGSTQPNISAVVAALERISEPIPEEEEEIEVEETVEASTEQTMKETERDIEERREEEGFKNLVIAKCDGWVNVRKEPSQDAEKVGKLYDKSAGEFIEESDGWYKISSGSCTGYVNSEYVVTGEDAVTLAKEVGTRICTVDTTTLKVRGEPSTDAETLGLVPMGEVLTVSEELDGWAKVNIEEGDGYVSLDYVKLSTEFVQAESKEEEEARLAKEERERQEAREAAAAAARANGQAADDGGATYNGNDDLYTGPKGKYSPTNVVTHVTEGGSALGIEVANYALQFNGNPYVYGGSDPVHGADCSGFVMAIYKHFGVSLPHSANADRKMGYAVNSLAEAEPGDLVCYSGHVGLYIGSGQIIHASSTKTGIKISDANYRAPLAIRRIF